MLSQIKMGVVILLSFTFFACQSKKNNDNSDAKKALITQEENPDSFDKKLEDIKEDIKDVKSKGEQVHDEGTVPDHKILEKTQKIEIETRENQKALSNVEIVVKDTNLRINDGVKLKSIDLLKRENSFAQKDLHAKLYLRSLNLDKKTDKEQAKALVEFFDDIQSFWVSVSPNINDNDIIESLNSDLFFFSRHKVNSLDSLKAISISLAEYQENAKSGQSLSLYKLLAEVIKKSPEIENGLIPLGQLSQTEKVIYSYKRTAQFLLQLRLNTYLALFITKYSNYGEKGFVKKILISWFSNYDTKFISAVQSKSKMSELKMYIDMIKYTFNHYKKLPFEIEIHSHLSDVFSLIEFEKYDEKNLTQENLDNLNKLHEELKVIKAEVDFYKN